MAVELRREVAPEARVVAVEIDDHAVFDMQRREPLDHAVLDRDRFRRNAEPLPASAQQCLAERLERLGPEYQ